MIRISLCALLSYLIGAFNPAALISLIRRKDIRKSGTGNLGATNVWLNFGKAAGGLTMAIDIAKAFAAYEIAARVLSDIPVSGMLAGCCAVLGHIFPFYLKFKGGKGLAAFAGLVLAYDPWLFLFLLITGCILMVIVNYSFILPFYATAFFAARVTLFERDVATVLFAVLISCVIFTTHFGNFIKAVNGKDRKIRDYFKRKEK